MAQMNAHIQSKATENGYTFFKLSALYDLPKGSLDLYSVLFSSNQFGANISLDGVHPSAKGQEVLAGAAVNARDQRALQARHSIATYRDRAVFAFAGIVQLTRT